MPDSTILFITGTFMIFSICFRSVYVWILVLSLFSTADGDDLQSGIYTYQETVGNKIVPFSWEVTVDGIVHTVTLNEKDKSFINVCSPDGATRRWYFRDGDRQNIVTERQGNILHISGIRDGVAYRKSVEIDERPWYQPLSFSLRTFLASDQQAVSFWTIRADTIEVVAMRVEKQGEEQLVVGGISAVAQKVEVRADGFFAHFWHGTYWFRKMDKLFLRYQSVHGGPGTAETIVELVSQPDRQ